MRPFFLAGKNQKKGDENSMRRRLAFLLVLVLLATTLAGCATNETAAEPASIVDAKIDENGNLILFMSSGTTINAGYVRGMQGEDGVDGIDGVNGDSITSAYVDEYGDLQLQLSDDRVVNAGHVQGADGRNGRDGADGQDGRDGKDGEDGEDGRDGKDGQDGKDGLNGQDGEDGKDGEDGIDGLTPSIGDNGNWWIGDTDTGVQAGAGEEFIFNDRGNGTTLLAYVGHDPDVVIPEKTRHIGEGAFQNNKSLTTVKISNNVSGIMEKAFSGCVSLESVDFPVNLLYIENEAFKGCHLLTQVDLGNKNRLQSIDESAFEGCNNLRTVKLPNSLTRIENRAFYNTSLESITIPQKVNYIGEEAFANVFTLESLIFAHTDKSTVQLRIEDRAFYRCGTSYSYSETEDGQIIYYGGLTSVNLPHCLYSLGDEVFADCSVLQSVSMPLIRNWGTGTFQNCYKLENFTFSSENLSGSGNFMIPAYTFSRCEALQSFVVPERVKRIKEYAFNYCTALKNVELGGTEWIGERAFQVCTALTIPDLSNVLWVGEYAFYYCIGFTGELRISAYIGDFAFFRCENLERVSFTIKNADGNSLRIGDYAFESCAKLKEARLFVNENEGGEGTTSSEYSLYAECIFADCLQLEKIVLGSALNPNRIGQGVFDQSYDTQDTTKQTFVIYSLLYPGSGVSFLNSHTPDEVEAIYVQPELVDAYKDQYSWHTYHAKIYPIESFGISVGAIQEDGSVKELKSFSNTQEIYVEYDYESIPLQTTSRFEPDGRYVMIQVSGFSGFSSVDSIRINGGELKIDDEEVCNFADTVNASKETIVSDGYLCFHEEMTRSGFRKAYDITIEGIRNGQSVTETTRIVAEFRPIGYVENPVASIAAVKSLSDKIQAEWDAEQNQLTLSYRSTDIEEITNLSSALEFTFHDKNGKPFEEAAIIYAGYTDFFVPTNEEGQIIEDGAKLTEESTALMKISDLPEWGNAVFGGESYDLVIRTLKEEYEPLDFTVYYVLLDGEPGYIEFKDHGYTTINGIGTPTPLQVVTSSGLDITDQCEFFYYDMDKEEISDGEGFYFQLDGNIVTPLRKGGGQAVLAKYVYNGEQEYTCYTEIRAEGKEIVLAGVESLSDNVEITFEPGRHRIETTNYYVNSEEVRKLHFRLKLTDAEGNPFPDGSILTTTSSDLKVLENGAPVEQLTMKDSMAEFQYDLTTGEMPHGLFVEEIFIDAAGVQYEFDLDVAFGWYDDTVVQNVESVSGQLPVTYNQDDRDADFKIDETYQGDLGNEILKITFADENGNPFPEGTMICLTQAPQGGELSTNLKLMDGDKEATTSIPLQDSAAYYKIGFIDDSPAFGFSVGFTIQTANKTYQSQWNNFNFYVE